MGEVKYLSNGDPVLVVGPGEPIETSNDGGRTLTQHDSLVVALLTTETVEAESVHDSPPAQNPSERVGTDDAARASRGEALNADQLDAEIARLQSERDQLAQGQ